MPRMRCRKLNGQFTKCRKGSRLGGVVENDLKARTMFIDVPANRAEDFRARLGVDRTRILQGGARGRAVLRVASVTYAAIEHALGVEGGPKDWYTTEPR